MALSGGRLGTLSFQWVRDRYQHHWKFGDHSPANITSRESDGSAVWPLSPPLQQIHLQSFDDGREVVFGVGMAGRGHWSASFTLVPVLDCWIVELACRAPNEPDFLLSTYDLGGGDWKDRADGSICCQTGQPLVRLEAVQPGSAVGLVTNGLQVKPLQLAKSPATNQWAFRVRIGTA